MKRITKRNIFFLSGLGLIVTLIVVFFLFNKKEPEIDPEEIAQFIAYEILSETNAVIFGESEKLISAKLPLYYNETGVIMAVNRIVDHYEDVFYATRWQEIETEYLIGCSLSAYGKIILVQCTKNPNIDEQGLFIYWGKNTAP